MGNRISTRWWFRYKLLQIPFSTKWSNRCGWMPERQLPRPAHNWDFSAMIFDATLTRCTVLLGYNNVRGRSGNSTVLEIYDSESNAWTRVSMEAPRFIQPRGQGLYSNVKFQIECNVFHGSVSYCREELDINYIARGLQKYLPSPSISLFKWLRWGTGVNTPWRGTWRYQDVEVKWWRRMVRSWDMAAKMVIYFCKLQQKSTHKISLPRHIGYSQRSNPTTFGGLRRWKVSIV